MKENRLIYRDTSYESGSLEERFATSQALLRRPERIASVIASNKDPKVLDSVSQGIRKFEPEFHSWTEVAADEDGRLATGQAYKNQQVRFLESVYGSAAGAEAAFNSNNVFDAIDRKYSDLDLKSLIKIFQDGEGYLPEFDRFKVLDALGKRIVVLINSNPREALTALQSAHIFKPIIESLNRTYEEQPNGQPWIFAASGYRADQKPTLHSLAVLQGSAVYNPLADLSPKYLQICGLLGTATNVHEILFKETKRIQFSSRFAPRAAEQILRDKIVECLIWAVPDFEERYLNDLDFRILADTVLNLVIRKSWIAYADGYGNLIGQERYDSKEITETVGSASDGEELQLLIGDRIYNVIKTSKNLTAGEEGRLIIYLNGEDTRRNFNIVVPWTSSEKPKTDQTVSILKSQGINEINIVREINRARTAAVKRREQVLRLSAHNLLLGDSFDDGAGLNGLEVRILAKNASPAASRKASEEVRTLHEVLIPSQLPINQKFRLS